LDLIPRPARLICHGALAVLLVSTLRAEVAAPNDIIVLNDDGGWCWFQDERAIVVRGKLFVGSVAMGSNQPERKGSIEIVSLDLRTREATRFPLHKNLETDDHAAPALLALPDGRLMAMYTKHGSENQVYWRISRQPADGTDWEPEQVFVPSESSRVTYSNLLWLSRDGRGGRVYNVFRGLDNTFKPSWMFSDDRGETWQTGGLLIDVPAEFRHRPYVKLASDGRDTIHFAFTEGHPRNFDNSIYHAVIDRGVIKRVNGTMIRPLDEGPILPAEAIRVFVGDSNQVAWIHDIAIDRRERLRLAWSVQMDSAGRPPRQGGHDHRYHWAEWDGRAWWDHEIAYAGSRLYPGEDDYTGGICLHPDDPDTVFISTNADPASGGPLPSGHYEIFRGRFDRRSTRAWIWESLTPEATEDNLRPIIPSWRRGRTALLWLRGEYRAYTDYDLEIAAWIE
jgi:hypothetical protein